MCFKTPLLNLICYTLLLMLAPAAVFATGAGSLPPERLFLQQVGSNSAIVKWRGGDADEVCYSPWLIALHFRWWPLCESAEETETGHMEAQLRHLLPDRTYYYILGQPGRGAANHEQRFNTAPRANRTPRDGNTHMWLIGDSGTATEQLFGNFNHPGEALEVKEAFFKYNRERGHNEPVDLFLLLGDNAYLEGTDSQWQGAFFDIYPEIANKAAVWPTIGNHEMGSGDADLCDFIPLPQCVDGPILIGGTSESSDPATYDGNFDSIPDPGGLPYLNIFSLPGHAELGGVPSGTEQYYSFDYANVHVVSLDSQLSNRDAAQREAMADWLIADLGNNFRDWTIVIFHHPPYSKGENHDSDVEQAEIDMRETFAPIFEDYGVDVVYGGHAHSYERSYYLNGHYGPSTTFDPQLHAELNADGTPATGSRGDEYSQVSEGSGEDDKIVYTVAGSSGKADEESPCPPGQTVGCTLPDWLEHPAHFISVPLKGSVVLDASRRTLRSRFIDADGQIVDQFTIRRGRHGHGRKSWPFR